MYRCVLAQGFLMYVTRKRLHVLDRRRGQDAVAEVEDVAGPAAGAREHVVGGRDDPLERTQQHCGLPVALNAAIEPDALPGFVERRAPVGANDIASRSAQLAENRARAHAEM